MVIEQPEHPLAFPAPAVAADEPLTIGQFYQEIRSIIEDLGDNVFSRRPRNQITETQMKHAVTVTDVTTARQAIDIIIDQGEGTAKAPLEIVGTDYAHYYRFDEIAHGRRLIRNPEATPVIPPAEQYIYGGDPIVLDPAGILKCQPTRRLTTTPRAAEPGELGQPLTIPTPTYSSACMKPSTANRASSRLPWGS